MRLWPTSPTLGQAAWWLGQSRESGRRFEAAIEAYRRIPPGHAQFLAGIDATARALRSALAAKPAEPRSDRRALAADGARYFASWTTAERPTVVAAGNLPAGDSVDAGPAEAWAVVRRQAALWAAEFYLQAGGDGPAKAVELLNAAVGETERENLPASNAPATWRLAADRLRVVALASAGRESDAARLLATLGAATPQSLLAFSESLAQYSESSTAEVRASLARLELQTLDAIEPRRKELSTEELRRVDLGRARALADSGHYDQALALLETLAHDRPTDGALQESLAELLSAGGREERKQALHKWREVQQKSRPGSPRWFRAATVSRTRNSRSAIRSPRRRRFGSWPRRIPTWAARR